MNILLVKMSSLGDTICTLPAITDLKRQHPEATIDWVLEESFVPVGGWHPGVHQVIPIALRRWRHQWWRSRHERRHFLRQLRATSYDTIIDAQGLIKSAVVSCLAHGRRVGYARQVAREPVVSITYQHRVGGSWQWHVVDRIRHLFAQGLNYDVDVHSEPEYGLSIPTSHPADCLVDRDTVLLLHNTSRANKYWPESSWRALIQQLTEQGLQVWLPWLQEQEHTRAQRLSASISGARVLPRLTLDEMASLIQQMRGVVTLDTGLGLLAAAMQIPTVSLYGPTNPDVIGTRGPYQTRLTFDDSPNTVVQALQQVMAMRASDGA